MSNRPTGLPSSTAGGAPREADPARYELVLKSLRFTCALGPERSLQGDGSLAGNADAPAIYLITAGRCVFARPGKPAISLAAGDFLGLTAGQPHTLRNRTADDEPASGSGSGALSFDSWLHADDPAMGTRYFAGTLSLAGDLAAVLPEIVHASPGREDSLLSRLAATIAAQAREMGPGAGVILSRLIETLLLEFARQHMLRSDGGAATWLRGLADPEVGPVLEAMLRQPEREWSVASLAQAGGMSRSTFARRFRDLTGLAPMDLLLELRMRRACERMRDDSEDLKSIAREVGYGSTAAFGVAFKRWSGQTPSEFRTDPAR